MNILSDLTVPTPRVGAVSFTDQVWSEALVHLAQVIGPDAERYRGVPAAKLTVAIGYLAGSEDPDRFAVSNLLTFHAATKARSLFNHRSTDDHDVRRRLATLQYGSLADPAVVDYGLNLLALISLSDHEHDTAEDARIGKYNPVSAGKWNASALRANLSNSLNEDAALKKRFDEVVGQDVGTLGWWTN